MLIRVISCQKVEKLAFSVVHSRSSYVNTYDLLLKNDATLHKQPRKLNPAMLIRVITRQKVLICTISEVLKITHSLTQLEAGMFFYARIVMQLAT